MRIYEHAASVMSRWLEERNMTAADLSREVEIDAGILRGILTGKKKSISTRNVVILARFFGLSVQELMDMLA